MRDQIFPWGIHFIGDHLEENFSDVTVTRVFLPRDGAIRKLLTDYIGLGQRLHAALDADARLALDHGPGGDGEGPAYDLVVYGAWLGSNIIERLRDQDCYVSAGYQAASILAGELDKLLSRRGFYVKDIDIDRKNNRLKVKLRGTDQFVATELNLSFSCGSDFDKCFTALFYRTDDDISVYEAELSARIMKTQIEPKFDTSNITDTEKVQLIGDIQRLSRLGGRVEIEARDDGAYVRVPFFDSFTYNTVRLNKNQRLATTIERVLKAAKEHVQESEPKSPLLAGYGIYWSTRFKNLVTETIESENSVELVISRVNFAGYMKGDLSAFEVVQKSILRVDGEKYSLTVWDPAL